MQTEELLAAAIGISGPWKIVSVNLDITGNRLDIEIGFERGRTFIYERHGELKAYDYNV